MTVEITTSAERLVDEANAETETLPVEVAITAHTDEDVFVVDLRDVREPAHDGKIPECFHMPRGMMEFWIDPEALVSRSSFTQTSVSFSIAAKAGTPPSPRRPLSEWG